MENEKTNTTMSALSENLAQAVAAASESLVAIHGRPRVASSGVMWRDGVVVSCDHTIKRDEELKLTLPAGKTIAAKLVGRDAGTDLAVLKIDEYDGARAANIGDSSLLQVGHLVLAVGRTDASGVSASFGIVSEAGGAWRTWRGGELDRYIRLDLSIYLGFSGGALIDTEGRIYGINTSALARGAGVAIPATTVNRVVDAILEKGSVARAYLGVSMQPVMLPAELRKTLNLADETGVIILNVEPQGPADQSGLLLGDVLIALDGQTITDTESVQRVLRSDRVGSELAAVIIRGGARHELNIKVGERPARQQRRGR